MKRVHTIWLGIGITLVIAGIIGCNMFDREHRNAPTEPSVEEPSSLMQRIEAMHPEWKDRFAHVLLINTSKAVFSTVILQILLEIIIVPGRIVFIGPNRQDQP